MHIRHSQWDAGREASYKKELKKNKSWRM